MPKPRPTKSTGSDVERPRAGRPRVDRPRPAKPGSPQGRDRKPIRARPVKAGPGKARASTPKAPTRARPEPVAASERKGERLQKVLAGAGIASRRAAEEMIAAGRVSVDGTVVEVQGLRVDPETVRIEVDGERVNVHPSHVYFMVNKPAGVVTTANDPLGRPTIVEMVRSRSRLYPVGRLDADTLGLVILTNDGALTHRLTHPRYQVRRIYLAQVKGEIKPEAVQRLASGVELEDGPAKAHSAKIRRKARTRSHVEVTMTEGRKHEVRRMFEAVGFPVTDLVRIQYGPVKLGDLGSGESRRLSPEEVAALFRAVSL